MACVFPFSILQNVTLGFVLNLKLGVLSAIGEYVFREFSCLQKYSIYIVRTIFQKTSTTEDD